ncbi:MAG: ABC transporter permease [Deltaproteobacteria bacterium]|nr:ABC transporter permease [Deltaproteobacteria bacterium]
MAGKQQMEAKRRLSQSIGMSYLRQFRQNGLGIVGAAISLLLALVALFAPVLAPYDPIQVEPDKIFSPMSWGHLLGTDELGRDILSRLIYGARISFLIGILAVAFKTVMGTGIGLVAGFYEGFIDHLSMRILDVIYAFPRTLLALLILAAVGPSIPALIFVIGLGGIPQFARIVRGSVLSQKQNEYIVAARALGSNNPRILWRYLLPNVLAPVLILSSLSLARAITAEASLSFLGLGVDPTLPTWGGMLRAGGPYLRTQPDLAFLPGLMIMFAVLGFNAMGDAIRDILDPRMLIRVRGGRWT